MARFLVVEDDPWSRLIVCEVLEMGGHAVLAAGCFHHVEPGRLEVTPGDQPIGWRIIHDEQAITRHRKNCSTVSQNVRTSTGLLMYFSPVFPSR